MLALSHHVIVRAAALRVGISNFVDYAVLGDDIVICNGQVAEEYLHLMKTLGVDINLSKSVISPDFAEFAKRLRGPDMDISPIGSGLITRFIRDKFYLGTLVLSAIKLQ
jgi:hypothetical protein